MFTILNFISFFRTKLINFSFAGPECSTINYDDLRDSDSSNDDEKIREVIAALGNELDGDDNCILEELNNINNSTKTNLRKALFTFLNRKEVNAGNELQFKKAFKIIYPHIELKNAIPTGEDFDTSRYNYEVYDDAGFLKLKVVEKQVESNSEVQSSGARHPLTVRALEDDPIGIRNKVLQKYNSIYPGEDFDVNNPEKVQIRKLLNEADKGSVEYIYAVQSALQYMGLRNKVGEIDGIMGIRTEKAIAEFLDKIGKTGDTANLTKYFKFYLEQSDFGNEAWKTPKGEEIAGDLINADPEDPVNIDSLTLADIKNGLKLQHGEARNIAIQKALYELGFGDYVGMIDGLIGIHSKNAIQEFQRFYNDKNPSAKIDVDGAFGPNTREAMLKALDDLATYKRNYH